MKKQKRIIVKKWDHTNQRLVARVYRASKHFITVVEYQSPILMASEQACKGRMYRNNKTEMSFGRGFIEDINNIAQDTSYLREIY